MKSSWCVVESRACQVLVEDHKEERKGRRKTKKELTTRRGEPDLFVQNILEP